MRALIWFRRDLRLRDNAALHHGCRAADRGVIGVFVVTPEQWRAHDDAPCKIDFMRRNLGCLSAALADRNIPLLIRETPRFAGVPAVLLDVARRHSCDRLYFNDEYELNETRRDEQVRSAFERDGRGVARFTDHVVFGPGEILTKQETFYTVFTPFRNAWLARLQNENRSRTLAMPRRQAPIGGVRSDAVPESIDGWTFDADYGRADLWPAGEDHARRRLRSFINDRISRYADDRNMPAVNGTSTLSPYINAGVLSPRQCLKAAVDADGGAFESGAANMAAWISELIWREFYQHVLVGFPRVNRHEPFDGAARRMVWNDNAEHLDAWREGRTRYPFVDAGMRQLRQTGWMHNRLRMVTAMFLSKNLLIDWRVGERFFMQNLIDGDLGSNNGGWQWSASTGADAAPYFRVFNPVTQSQRFDPDGSFIRRYCPELDGLDSRSVHAPWTLDADRRRRLDYPRPIVDHAATRRSAIERFKAARRQ